MDKGHNSVPQNGQPSFELFHVLTDPDCIAVRKLIVELNLHERVKFRNVDIYDEHCQALLKLTGEVRIPCLWAQGKAFIGREAISDFLKKLG